MDAENLNFQNFGRQSRCSGRISSVNLVKFRKSERKVKGKIDSIEIEKYRNMNYKGSLSFNEIMKSDKSAGYIQAEFDELIQEEEQFFKELVSNLHQVLEKNK